MAKVKADKRYKAKVDSHQLDVCVLQAHKTSQDMADILGLTRVSYHKKRHGEIQFTVADIIRIKEALNLSPHQTSDIFLSETYLTATNNS